MTDRRAKNGPRKRKSKYIPREVQDAVIRRDGMVCRYCGKAVRVRRAPREQGPDTIELDHVIPLVLGGESTVDNLVVACLRCNRSKCHRQAPKGMAA